MIITSIKLNILCPKRLSVGAYLLKEMESPDTRNEIIAGKI